MGKKPISYRQSWEKIVFPTLAPSEDSDQPAHLRSVLRTFIGRILDRKWCLFFILFYFILHYENTPIQIYRKFYHQKMNIFR